MDHPPHTADALEHPPHTADLEARLAEVTSREDLAALLRELHIRADSPSLRELDRRTAQARVRLTKSTVADMLAGSHFPRKAVLVAFLRECGVVDERAVPWAQTWERIAATQKARPASDATDKLRSQVEELAETSHARAEQLAQRCQELELRVAEAERTAQRAEAARAQLAEQVAALTDAVERQTAHQAQQLLAHAQRLVEVERLAEAATRQVEESGRRDSDRWRVMFRGGSDHRGFYPRGPQKPGFVPWKLEFGVADAPVALSPTVLDNSLFIGGKGDHRLHTIDAFSGEPAGWHDVPGPVVSSVAYDSATVYVASKGQLGAFYATQRDVVKWQVTFDSASYLSSPTVFGNLGETVYIGGDDGHVYAVRTQYDRENESFSSKIAWRAPVNGEVISSPAAAPGALYVGSTDHHLYAITHQNEMIWRTKTGGAILSSPALAYWTVYVGSDDGRVYAVDTTTGQVRWMVETGGPVRSSPAVVGGTVYVGSDDGNLYALSAATGHLRWRLQTEGPVASSPAVSGELVYVGSNDATLYCVRTVTGESAWTYRTQGEIGSSPAVASGVVYVASSDGFLYAIDAITGRGPGESQQETLA